MSLAVIFGVIFLQVISFFRFLREKKDRKPVNVKIFTVWSLSVILNICFRDKLHLPHVQSHFEGRKGSKGKARVKSNLRRIYWFSNFQLALHPGLSIHLAITAFLFGVLGLASYPVGLEMASECTFPVSETTSTGVVVLSGQVCFFATWLVIFRKMQESQGISN